ncbi:MULTISPECIES: DUF4279 domain-containing protein [Pseudomonas]|jgi:hypothetical protein|uniref:DUF4279 domain-containing protein n=1 Tax=Pseudomonas TaxID=286 RepID=UPI0009E308FF|nr:MULTISPECIES: DUF4279 domain-containing protein [Pseudomonas]WAB94754.1 DUF4279 domain-containing protein [Pseudomonas citronellolis]
MDSSLQIDFQLLGTTVSPKDISRIIEIVPDTALLQGERNPTRGLPRQNVWSVRSRSKSSDLVDHWKSLEAALLKAKEKIRNIARTGKAKITIIVSDGDRIPPLTIPPAMSEFAGFIKAEIDIDHLQ